MALGSNNNQESKYQLIILRPSFPKDGGKPSFSVVKKQDGAYVEMSETVDKFTGNLVKIELGDLYNTESERGRELAAKYGNSKAVSLTFLDEEAGEQYLVRFSFRLYTRAFFNALLNVKSVENLQVSLWQDRETKHNRISLRQNDEIVKWKYSMDEIPAPEITKNSKGAVVDTDYSSVDAFFYEKLEEFASKMITKKDLKQKEEKSSTKKSKEEKSEQKIISEDDIPF